MTRRKKLLLTAGGYFITILVFALAYYIFWLKNTSNFIINQDFNELTIKPIFFYGEIPESFTYDTMPLTTKQANELMAPKFDSLSLYKRRIENLDSLIKINNKEDSILFKSLWKSHDRNLETYLNKILQSNNKIKDSISAKIDYMKKQLLIFTNKQQDYYNLEIEIARSNYQLSLNEVSIAKMRANVYTEGLKNAVKFYDDTLYRKSVAYNNERIRLEDHKSITLGKVEEAKEYIRKIDFTYHWSRSNRVAFSDFVYFSVITATSTGYGDILPNTKIIRILVSLQIVISLLLFGLFLNWLTTKDINV